MKTKNKSYSTFNILIVILLSLLCIVYFTWFQKFLPTKLTVDSLGIKKYFLKPINISILGHDNSAYKDTAFFFKCLGFNYFTPIIFVQLFSWIVFQGILFVIIKINGSVNFSPGQLCSLIFFSIMYGAYFSTYSKDLLVALFLLIDLYLYINHKKLSIVIIFIFIYGFIFRPYWLLILFIWMFIALGKKINIKHEIFLIIFLTLIIIFAYNIITGNQISNLSSRIFNNTANSSIQNIIPNSSFITDIINYFYVLVSLFLPIQGISSSHMIIYYIWIWVILYLFKKYKSEFSYKDIKLFLLFICFISVQALFEPDFGSAFRHQIVLFPLIYYIFNDCKMKLYVRTTNS